MQSLRITSFFNKAFGRWIVAACGLLVSMSMTDGAGAQASCPDASTSNVPQVADKSPVATASPMSSFPAGGIGEIVFNQPLEPPKTFHVFRIRGTNDGPQTKPVAVLSVEKAKDKSERGSVVGFTPNDSAALRVAIDDDGKWYWENQYFVVVACAGGQGTGWGTLTARVSPALTPLWICWAALLLAYLFAMGAVWLSRRAEHPLAAKYPATFEAKKFGGWDFLNPVHLTADSFNRASVQKLQVLMFSSLVGFLVLDLVLRTGALAALSPTVVGLLGISGVGAAAAQITYRQRTRLSFENWAWLQNRGVIKATTPTTGLGPQWRDLVLTNREFDVYKLQTLIFSVTVAVALVVGGASSLATFTVPETLLGILGLSQVVYVGGILVRPPAVDDLDQALTKLRAAGEAVAASKTQNTDTDANGKLLPPPLPPGQTPALNAQRQYDDLADQVIPMLESTLEVQADRSKL